MRQCIRVLGALLVVSSALPASLAAQPPSYMNFEAGQVRPLALSPDGTRLFAVNTPDDRLEIFDLTGPEPVLAHSVPVGLSPVAVAVQDANTVWVVNHLSDSVSIVDVGPTAVPPRVRRTLRVGDEPSDIVFAGAAGRLRAFVTAAHRGQALADPRGEYSRPGVGRADVWVFDDLGGPRGPSARILTLFGDRPRALAASPDGTRVYAAVFQSGNGTTTVSEGVVCDGGPGAPPCFVNGERFEYGLPAPIFNAERALAPETGLIVRQDWSSGRWLDELGRDWSSAVRFDLPDHDVFEIDATTDPPRMIREIDHVGTVLFNMVATTDAVFVSNTEAFNEVRFEGPGDYVRAQGLRGDGPYTVRGHLHESRITAITGGAVRPVRLNPHIRYEDRVTPPGTWEQSIATPLGMALSSDGQRLYLAAYGSAAVAVLRVSDLRAGRITTSPTG